MRTLLALSKPYLVSCGLLLPLLLGQTLLVRGVVSAQQTAEQPDPAARQAFEDGRTFYDHGRFADALRKFQESYAISNNAKLLFNIGRAADSDGQAAQAYDAYTAYLQRVPDADNREFVEARLAKLKAAGAGGAPVGAAAAAAAGAPAAPPAQVDAPIDPYPAPYVSPGQAQTAYVGPVSAVPAETPPPANLPGSFRLYGGVRLGVGGNMHISNDDDEFDNGDADLKTSFGLQAGAEWVPVRWFGVGLELRLVPFNEEFGDQRDRFLDFALKPSFRGALRRIPLEFYGALPIGLSSVFADDPIDEDVFDIDVGVGGNIGFMAGMNYFLTPHFGLNFELGVLIHWYGADVLSEGEKVGSLSYTLTQFTLLTLNAVYAL